MNEKNFQKEGGIFAYPNLKVTRLALNYDPPQLALFYKRYPNEKKLHLFVIQLNSLILLGDPEKITCQLFEKYPAFLCESVVSVDQIFKLVSKMIEYIHKLMQQYQEEEVEDERSEILG